MALVIPSFKGEVPRLSPRYLGPGYGVEAINARFDDGQLSPFRQSALAASGLGLSAKSIYKHAGTWLAFSDLTAFAKPPIDTTRIYYANAAIGLKMRETGGTVYDVALPAPTGAPTAVLAGSLDADLAEAVGYAYTWVTGFGEESPPSPISTLQDWSPGMTATVNAFDATPAGRNITHKRIYRTQTSEAGVTDLYFVAEITEATTSYAHNPATTPLAEPIATTDYDTPPADLSGIETMANGIMVGFSGKTVCFSEPYVPYAWPVKYRRTVDDDIVAIASFGQSVAVMTTGRPVIIQGSAPENMVQSRVEEDLPCRNAAGVVNYGYSCAYPSDRGLVRLATDSASIVSLGVFSEEDWEALSPETFYAENYEGDYMFAYMADDLDVVDGQSYNSTFAGLDTLDAGGVSGPGAENITYSGGSPNIILGNEEVGIIDLNGDEPYFSRVQSNAITSGVTTLWANPSDGKIYFANVAEEVRQFDSAAQPVATYAWKSAEHWSPHPKHFTGILVQSPDAIGDADLTVNVYADDTLLDTDTVFGSPRRLAGGMLANKWQIELIGTASVNRVYLVESFDQLAGIAQ